MNINHSKFVSVIKNEFASFNELEFINTDNGVISQLIIDDDLKFRVELQSNCIYFHKVGLLTRWPMNDKTVYDLKQFKNNIHKLQCMLYVDDDDLMEMLGLTDIAHYVKSFNV